MATSGTYAFAPNRAKVRQDALEMVGGDIQGENDPYVVASANHSLNALIKALNANKTDVNAITRTEVDTVIGTASIDLPAGTIGIDTAAITVSGNTYGLTAISSEQYHSKRLQTSTGRPIEFYHDLKADKVYLSPVPDAVYTLNYGRISQYQDIDDDSQTFDLPSSAIEMLTFGLAHRLAIKRGIPLAVQHDLYQHFKDAERKYVVASYGYTKRQTASSAMIV